MDLSALFPFESGSAAETRALGRRVAETLKQPWVLALYGTLGAGKTQFAKGLADGLALDGDAVTSPTFTIVQEYRSESAALIHIDAYRIERPSELMEAGVDELIYGVESCVIEWPERLETLLDADTIRLRFTHAGSDRRRIEWVAGPGDD